MFPWANIYQNVTCAVCENHSRDPYVKPVCLWEYDSVHIFGEKTETSASLIFKFGQLGSKGHRPDLYFRCHIGVLDFCHYLRTNCWPCQKWAAVGPNCLLFDLSCSAHDLLSDGYRGEAARPAICGRNQHSVSCECKPYCRGIICFASTSFAEVKTAINLSFLPCSGQDEWMTIMDDVSVQWPECTPKFDSSHVYGYTGPQFSFGSALTGSDWICRWGESSLAKRGTFDCSDGGYVLQPPDDSQHRRCLLWASVPILGAKRQMWGRDSGAGDLGVANPDKLVTDASCLRFWMRLLLSLLGSSSFFPLPLFLLLPAAATVRARALKPMAHRQVTAAWRTLRLSSSPSRWSTGVRLGRRRRAGAPPRTPHERRRPFEHSACGAVPKWNHYEFCVRRMESGVGYFWISNVNLFSSTPTRAHSWRKTERP